MFGVGQLVDVQYISNGFIQTIAVAEYAQGGIWSGGFAVTTMVMGNDMIARIGKSGSKASIARAMFCHAMIDVNDAFGSLASIHLIKAQISAG